MTDKQFIEAVYELAFGHDSVNTNFSHAEVMERLKKFNEDALKWDDIPYIDKARLDPDYEPTDQEMMSSFGTKWHDGL